MAVWGKKKKKGFETLVNIRKKNYILHFEKRILKSPKHQQTQQRLIDIPSHLPFY